MVTKVAVEVIEAHANVPDHLLCRKGPGSGMRYGLVHLTYLIGKNTVPSAWHTHMMSVVCMSALF